MGFFNRLFGAIEAGCQAAKVENSIYHSLREEAENGDASAQCQLGSIYHNGQGMLVKNDVEALKWYRKSAGQGNADGQFFLGLMYLNGYGTPKNYIEALSWFHKAAEQGQAGAQLNLGSMFENGLGVPRNEIEALRWYRKASEYGTDGMRMIVRTAALEALKGIKIRSGVRSHIEHLSGQA